MALPCEQRMTVALDQAGQHASSLRIDRRHVVVAVCSQDLGRGTDRNDPPLPNGHRAVGDDVEIGLRWSAPDLATVVNLGQRRGMDDVEVVHRSLALRDLIDTDLLDHAAQESFATKKLVDGHVLVGSVGDRDVAGTADHDRRIECRSEQPSFGSVADRCCGAGVGDPLDEAQPWIVRRCTQRRVAGDLGDLDRTGVVDEQPPSRRRRRA